MSENLNKLISQWRKDLHSRQYLEEGLISELENHLIEEIENLENKGYTSIEAFSFAKEKLGDISSLEIEEKKVIERKDSLLTFGLLASFTKVGGRYFRKNKLLSAINMGGLVIAFAATLFIGLFIHDEMSFEKHHPDYDKIYRLSYSFQEENGTVEDRAVSSGMWSELLTPRNPSIEESFRFLKVSYGYIFNPEEDQTFYEEGIYWSDPNFFNFLNFPLKLGRQEDQLKNHNSIILTEKTAKKIFGEENPLGKTLKYRRTVNEVNLVVTGVIFDPPSNSHFQPDYVAHIQSVQSIYGEQHEGWIDKNPVPGYVFTYLKIRNSQDLQTISNDLIDLWTDIVPDLAEQMNPLITPISSIHFNPPIKWELGTPVNMSYIYGLMIIGYFILMIALTNFTNLTTAQGSKRQKEIGLRKTLGSSKSQLKIQFFIESCISVLAAMFLTLILVYILLNRFNTLVDKNIDLFSIIRSFDFVILFGSMVVGILIFSGLLPALYFTRQVGLSSSLTVFFNKEKVNSPSRNILIVIQFTVAITLVIGTLTIYNQLELINGGLLGKNRETVVGIRTSRMGDSIQAQSYKSKIESISGILSNTLGMHLPRQSDFGRINTRYRSEDKAFYWNKFDADGGFLSTYDLKLIAGRDFGHNIQLNQLIVNEEVLRELNVTADAAIGMYLKEDSINYVFEGSDGVIIGVVEDFVYKSVKEKIEPLVICANNWAGGVLSVKLGNTNKLNILNQMNEMWREIYPGRPFEYWFLDAEFERLYNQERRLGKLVPIFSGLAILISLLGLFALSVFISELRMKEIGIRKVLGCSTGGILKLLSWQYIKTLIPAIFISVPIAYFGLNYWLNNFSYRVNVNFNVIAFSVFAVVFISLLTVSLKSLSTSLRNPVESLKYE